MPSSYVCVLHSGNGFYTDALVGNALRCLHAVQGSVRANAPDFIPSIAVFLADPQSGARCIYSSVVPDRNHALDRVAATYPPLADASGNVFALDDGAAETQAERTTAFAQLFRLRSPQFLQQAVLLAVQKQNATAPISTGVEHEGFASVASSTPSYVLPPLDGDDTWGSLAGALLACLCYLRAHASSAVASSGVDDADVDASDVQDDLEGNVSGKGAPSSYNSSKVMVFSDAGTKEAPSYSAECALAVAAVTASKMGVVVSCFGDAVVQAASTENRLVGLASSLGGFCAARFTLADLGQLLDGESGLTKGSTGNRTRQKRDRIASQFVVGPTMLPRVPAPSSTIKNASGESPVKKEKKDIGAVGAAAARERFSHLGWLCPSCMAILYRSPGELSDSSLLSSSRLINHPPEDGGAEQELSGRCPYCYTA